jgi:hypothetical protein
MFLVILSIFVAGYSTIYNFAKPLTGPTAIWEKNRLQKIDQVSSGLFYNTFLLVENFVPSNDTLGLVLFRGFYEYPFFGKSLSRNLIPIYPDSKLADSDWVSENGINWILLCKPLPIPNNFTEVGRVPSFLNECSLLRKDGPGTTPASPAPSTSPIALSNLAYQKTVTASGSRPDAPAGNAVDDGMGLVWNAGGFPPQWIQIDLGAPAVITEIRLQVEQYPESDTVPRIQVLDASGALVEVHRFSQATNMAVSVYKPK